MYRREIELRADNAGVAYSNLASQVAASNLDGAIKLCRQGIETDPNDARIWNELARHLRARGDLEQAEEAARRVVELEPDVPRYLFTLAEILKQQNQSAESFQLKTKAMRLSADIKPGQLNALAWQLVSSPEESLREPATAIALAEKAVKLDPDAAEIWNTLGIAYYEHGDWQQAVDALEKSAEIGVGNNSYNTFFLAMAHWQLGNEDSAREYFDQAVDDSKWTEAERLELTRFREQAERLMGLGEDDAAESNQPEPVTEVDSEVLP